MNGLLSGDKVRPVLINSKLPLDVLGKVMMQTDISDNVQLSVNLSVIELRVVSCRFGI